MKKYYNEYIATKGGDIMETMPNWFWGVYAGLMVLTLIMLSFGVVRKRLGLRFVSLISYLAFLSSIVSSTYLFFVRPLKINEFSYILEELSNQNWIAFVYGISISILTAWWIAFIYASVSSRRNRKAEQ